MKRNKRHFPIIGLILFFTLLGAISASTVSAATFENSAQHIEQKATKNVTVKTLVSEKNANNNKEIPNIKDIIPLEDKSSKSSDTADKQNLETTHEAASTSSVIEKVDSNVSNTPSSQQDYNLADKEIDLSEDDSSPEDVSVPPSLSEATIYDDASPLSDYPSPGKQSITQINRYATVTNKATKAQINPLNAIAQFKFSPNVKTIGDAINHVLQNTSYKLVPENKLSPLAKETLAQSLPVTVRTLGPISIKNAVIVLIGQEVFSLQIDLAHRVINFKTKSVFAFKRCKKRGK